MLPCFTAHKCLRIECIRLCNSVCCTFLQTYWQNIHICIYCWHLTATCHCVMLIWNLQYWFGQRVRDTQEDSQEGSPLFASWSWRWWCSCSRYPRINSKSFPLALDYFCQTVWVYKCVWSWSCLSSYPVFAGEVLSSCLVLTDLIYFLSSLLLLFFFFS